MSALFLHNVIMEKRKDNEGNPYEIKLYRTPHDICRYDDIFSIKNLLKNFILIVKEFPLEIYLLQKRNYIITFKGDGLFLNILRKEKDSIIVYKFQKAFNSDKKISFLERKNSYKLNEIFDNKYNSGSLKYIRIKTYINRILLIREVYKNLGYFIPPEFLFMFLRKSGEYDSDNKYIKEIQKEARKCMN